MKIKREDFCVKPGERVDLQKWPTRVSPVYKSKKHYQELLETQVAELSTLQHLHYASNRYALLLILQGMDAAGKDGAIRRLMTGINPQGCEVYSFKQPSAEELQHDFLWRTSRCLPERGRIGIFNRSYYEDVVIVRVHPELLRNQISTKDLAKTKNLWDDRYHSIVDHESHLHRNGTRFVKIFLHESKDEQCKRFLERIDEPQKNWKLSAADLEERKLWSQYMKAYEDCFRATSTDPAPWYIVPADDKKNAALIIAVILTEVFKSLKMTYPKTTEARRKELGGIKKSLCE